MFATLIQPAAVWNQHIVALLKEVQRLRGVVIAHFIALHYYPCRQAIDAPSIVLLLHVDDGLVALIFRHVRTAGFQAADDGAAHREGALIIPRALLTSGRGNDVQAIDHHHVTAGVPGFPGVIRQKAARDLMVVSRHGRSLVEITQRQVRIIARLRCNDFFRAVLLLLVGSDYLRAGVIRQRGTTADEKHGRCGADNRNLAIVRSQHALLPPTLKVRGLIGAPVWSGRAAVKLAFRRPEDAIAVGLAIAAFFALVDVRRAHAR